MKAASLSSMDLVPGLAKRIRKIESLRTRHDSQHESVLQHFDAFIYEHDCLWHQLEHLRESHDKLEAALDDLRPSITGIDGLNRIRAQLREDCESLRVQREACKQQYATFESVRKPFVRTQGQFHRKVMGLRRYVPDNDDTVQEHAHQVEGDRSSATDTTASDTEDSVDSMHPQLRSLYDAIGDMINLDEMLGELADDKLDVQRSIDAKEDQDCSPSPNERREIDELNDGIRNNRTRYEEARALAISSFNQCVGEGLISDSPQASDGIAELLQGHVPEYSRQDQDSQGSQLLNMNPVVLDDSQQESRKRAPSTAILNDTKPASDAVPSDVTSDEVSRVVKAWLSAVPPAADGADFREDIRAACASCQWVLTYERLQESGQLTSVLRAHQQLCRTVGPRRAMSC